MQICILNSKSKREKTMETRQDKLIRLATEMANKGELTITPESAEYQLLDYLLTDDELAVMSEMKLVMPSTARGLAKKTGMPVDKVKIILFTEAVKPSVRKPLFFSTWSMTSAR